MYEMMNEWQPLTDLWEKYSDTLDGIETAEIAEEVVWPAELFMGNSEKEDVKNFVSERIEEMIEQAKAGGGINLQYIGGFLFKSLVTGMMWERERVGK